MLETIQISCFFFMFYPLVLAFIHQRCLVVISISFIPSTFINWDFPGRKDCPFYPIYLTDVQSFIYINMHSWTFGFFFLWVIIQSCCYFFCSNCAPVVGGNFHRLAPVPFHCVPMGFWVLPHFLALKVLQAHLGFPLPQP